MSQLSNTARLLFDIFIFLAICFADFAIHRWAVPFKRGFFCGDESLQYPYRVSTIGIVALVVIVLAVPGFIIAAVELFKRLAVRKNSNTAQSNTGCRLGQRFASCCAQMGYYLFGLALTLVATEVGKYSVGRLRPHFFAVCQPQLPNGSSCEQLENHGRYIEDYTCLGVNSTATMLKQLGQSFPSGHSSFIFYAMFYLCIYLQSALSTRASKLLKHVLQFVFVMLAWYVALTRVSDYWHHWSDVLAGAVLGTLLACLVAHFVAKLNVRAIAPLPPAKPTASSSSSAKSATPVLPAYTFGSMPYLHHPQQYGQTYHNYGYVP